MAIDRTNFNHLIDDDGTNLVGTVWNKTQIKDVILDPVDAALSFLGKMNVVPNSDTGTVNDWAPGLAGNTYIEWSGVGNLTINSIAGGVVGQVVTIANWSANSLVFCNHYTPGGPNCFYNPVTSGPIPITRGGWVTYVKAAGSWNLIAHEQGAWITPPFNAANFTGLAPMTWTVAAGNVQEYQYRVVGQSLALRVAIVGATLGGSPSSQCLIQLPGGYTSKGIIGTALCIAYSGGTTQLGRIDHSGAQIQAGPTLAGSPWSVGVMHVYGIAEALPIN